LRQVDISLRLAASDVEERSMALRVTVGVAALCLVGCASAPERLAPIYPPVAAYQDRTCEQLATEMAHLNAAYTHALEAERYTRSVDTAGNLSLSPRDLGPGEWAIRLASVRGSQAMVEYVAHRKACAGVTVRQFAIRG
jgi:hypothetical protein